MGSKLNRSITVFMAALVLLSSTGFGFIEHQCMMRGKSVQFVSEKKSESCEKKVVYSCCAKSKATKTGSGTFFKKTECCKDSQKLEKISVVSSQSAVLSKLIKASSGDLFWATTAFKFLRNEWIVPDSSVHTHSISFSSLFHGRSTRIFVQSFLI